MFTIACTLTGHIFHAKRRHKAIKLADRICTRNQAQINVYSPRGKLLGRITPIEWILEPPRHIRMSTFSN